MSVPRRKSTTGREASATGSEARSAIIGAAVEQLLAKPAPAVTIDSVAAAAKCAKGLVHYHFKTKANLLSAAAAQIWEQRTAAWREALSGADPAGIITSAWSLLASEGSGGVTSAAASLGTQAGEIVGRTVRDCRQRFVSQLGSSTESMFGRMGLATTVQTQEIALLLGAVIEGLGLQVASGTPTADLEPAWAAFWAGVLSLTGPA
jgi:AcrR family transcriptional regulator